MTATSFLLNVLLISIVLSLYHTLPAHAAVKKGNYNTAFFVGIDRTLTPAELDPNAYQPVPAYRNQTFQYNKAIEYFNFMYGLDFSNGKTIPNVTLLQVTSPGYKVYGSYGVKGRPDSAGATDVGMHDDAYSAVVTGDLKVYGAYGGDNGTMVQPGRYLVYGYYTFFWKENGTQIFAPTKYYAPMPMYYQVDGAYEVGCVLESTLFGSGFSKGAF